jgi:hypothetical protein
MRSQDETPSAAGADPASPAGACDPAVAGPRAALADTIEERM